MATKSKNRMKATVWTPTSKSEIDGTPDGVIPLAFYALQSQKRRAACIAELQEIDKKMTARETETPIQP